MTDLILLSLPVGSISRPVHVRVRHRSSVFNVLEFRLRMRSPVQDVTFPLNEIK